MENLEGNMNDECWMEVKWRGLGGGVDRHVTLYSKVSFACLEVPYMR
jgi:hypothetical protein